MFLISIKYSFKKINVSFQTIHCLILYLDRCLYSSLKKKRSTSIQYHPRVPNVKKVHAMQDKNSFQRKKKAKIILIILNYILYYPSK